MWTRNETTSLRVAKRRGNLANVRLCISALVITLLVSAGCASKGETYVFEDSSSSVPLFDGKTFTGWEGNLEHFRIEDGAIVGGTMDARIPNNEFLATTARYSDFELRVTFKLLGQGANAGIQFRTDRIPDHHEVIGYQADMGQIYWGSLYDESRRNTILAQADPDLIKDIVRHEDWNTYRIRAEGPRIRLWLNDQLTVDYTERDSSIPRDGIIALQIHGGPPSEAHYKDIHLWEL